MSTIRDSLTGRAFSRRVPVSVPLSLAIALTGGVALGSVLAYPRLTPTAETSPIVDDGRPAPPTPVVQTPRKIELAPTTIVATKRAPATRDDRLRTRPPNPGDPSDFALVPCSNWRPLQIGSGYVRNLCRPGSVSEGQAGLLSLQSPPPASHLSRLEPPDVPLPSLVSPERVRNRLHDVSVL